MKVTVENQGQSHEYTIPMQSFERASFKGRKSPSDYGLDARKILYVDAGIIGLLELDQMMKTNLNAKGMILDMRKYPRWDIMEVLGKYLYPQPTTFMWYSINSKKFPGNFGLDIIGKIGFKENPDYFKGKIAILVNEMTQSFGELMSVAYRVAPKVRLSVRKLPVRTVMSDIYICLGESNSPIQWREHSILNGN